MVNLKKKLVTAFLALALVFTGCMTDVPDSYAATAYPFTQSKVAVKSSYLSKFVVENIDGETMELNGAFSESGAKAFSTTGTAKKTLLPNDGKAARLIFYYAVVLDEAKTGLEKYRIQNALSYLHQGEKGLSKAQIAKAKTMIEESSVRPIPDYYRFKAYRFKSTTKVKDKYPSFIGYKTDAYQIRVGITYNKAAYFNEIKIYGGYPVLLPYIKTEQEAIRELANVDCLLIPGGDGINPSYYGAEQRNTGSGSVKRDPTDFNYIKVALSLDIPVLAICRGHQMMNVVAGGTLFQDIKKECGSNEKHKGVVHNVRVLSNTLLSGIIGAGQHKVYCNHHQCVERIGKNIKVNARSTDGIIEASNITGKSFALSLQFHPEKEQTILSLETYKIITRFINEGSKYVERTGHPRLYMRDVHIPTVEEINEKDDEENPA